ncbi:MAG: tryptophan synthase subunit alpha, partial [Bacteroidetes bacterium]|nr:tryptophan synthase subunit alpha [Bacteroidota bacterium]
NILLITPQTTDDRIKKIDNASTAFIYAVSSASTTGTRTGISDSTAFLKKLSQMHLKHPILTGFNINNRDAYLQACKYTRGAIIGSAFIKAISNNVNLEDSIQNFISSVLNE